MAHLLSQVGFVLLCVAFFGYDLEEEEEGEFKLRLGGGGGCGSLDVWALGTKQLIVITLLVTISNSAPEEWTESVAASSS